jgi:hypothetical protein
LAVLAKLRRSELDATRRELGHLRAGIEAARAARRDLWESATTLAQEGSNNVDVRLRGQGFEAARCHAGRLASEMAELAARQRQKEAQAGQELLACRQVELTIAERQRVWREECLRRQQRRMDEAALRPFGNEAAPGTTGAAAGSRSFRSS